MKAIRMMLLAAVTLMLAATAASARPATPRVDRREARQQAPIHQGVRSGQLTAREAARLRAGERQVHRIERRAKADGVVTARERARLDRVQNRESRAIYRLKHNPRTR
jgi:hypothetical protein